MPHEKASAHRSPTVQAISTTTTSFSSAAAAAAAATTDFKSQQESPSKIESTTTHNSEADWDLIADNDIPKASDESAEAGFEAVGLTQTFVECKLDGEAYIGWDFTSSDAKLRLLTQLKIEYDDSIASMTRCLEEEQQEDFGEAERHKNTATTLQKAIEALEQHMRD